MTASTGIPRIARLSPPPVGAGRGHARPRPAPTTSQPSRLRFPQAVTDLLAERGWTQRSLARAVGVDPAHINRLLRPTARTVSPTLLSRVAEAFDLPPEYFHEYRQWRIAEAVRDDPALSERLYRRLARASLDDSPPLDADPPNDATALRFATVALLRDASSSPPAPLSPARGRFTPDEIVAAIRRWNQRHGEPPKTIDWDPSRARKKGQRWRAERFERDNWPTLAMVRRQFGTMSNALHAAGLRPRPRPVRPRGRLLSHDDILRAIRDWNRLYGEPPTMSDWAPGRARRTGQEWRVQRYLAGDWPSCTTVLKRFGTLGAAIEAAGLEPRPRGRHARGDAGLHPDTRHAISQQLAAAEAPCGPGILATRVRAIAEARHRHDPPALRGALIDLATAALSWADAVGTVLPPDAQRQSAA